MSKTECPLGEDCDLTLAYMMGAEKAKDTITALRAEVERLRGFEAANRLNAAQVAAQRAEVEKLRAALQRVRRWGSPIARGYIDNALGRSDRGNCTVVDGENSEVVTQEEKQ